MCNQSWIDILPKSCYESPPRASSDHSTMVVHLLRQAKPGPIPFKFFNYWNNMPCFKDKVNEAWNIRSQGSPFYVAVSKLKHLKILLKKCWQDDGISISSKLTDIRQQLAVVHKKLSKYPLSEEFKEVQLQNKLGFWLANEEDQARQKRRED